MNIRDMKYLVAVADERHFGRAALKCHVSQPALSGQIRKLEDQLGVMLFERTNRRVQITPIGEQIVEQARKLVTLSEEIVTTAQLARDPLSGPFRLGMIATIGPYLSPLVLTAIRKQLPNVQLTLIEDMTGNLENRLVHGQLDAALLATPPQALHMQDLPLYDEPFWVALPRNHPLATRDAIDLSELHAAELLLLADGHCFRDQMLEACNASAGTASANTRETSLETLLALVAAGDGVTLLPELAKPGGGAVKSAMLIRPEATRKVGRTVRLVSRTSFPRTEILHQIARIIRAHVPKAMLLSQNEPMGY
ncbi:LysR substrate-binding domain-containing protein [Sneathiella marina]|uniref:LysR substrate-binding domain-containing protein n=1 Tax=Sneathiella marina TaxID=2950108 RepID=A0ABY4W446_9PROT|nr:LysR substrate-binding domain-containing protein [Sneathiella marina]USG61965.1 LysR substrate-binding domain-containing protein [Sneathiella marina]